MESGRVDSAGVEWSSSAELQGSEVQTLMDKFRANAGDPYKGVCQSYNPAPPSTLRLTDQNRNVAADATAGVGSAAAAAAAAPGSAQKAYQHLKEVCQCVDTNVKEVFTYCLAQREEGHLCDDAHTRDIV